MPEEPSSASDSPPRDTVTIRCREDGPLVVDLPGAGSAGGPRVMLRVIDHTGREFPLPTHKPAVALCRCGQSATKPFCDGSHVRAGFRGAATDTRPGGSP